MRRVYNFITNDSKTIHSKQTVLDSETVLYDEFKNIIIKTKDYSTARQEILEKIVETRAGEIVVQNTRSVVDSFSTLNGKYFESSSSLISNDICDILVNNCSIDDSLSSFASLRKNLLDYMTQIISKMSEVDYNFLIDTTNNWKEFIFFTLQPVFIVVLGVKDYVVQVPYLMSGNNLVQLFAHAKNRATQPYIQQLLSDFTVMPVRTILAVSTIVMIPVLYLCYKAIYPSVVSPVPMVKSNETVKVSIPKITPPSLKDENSKPVAKEFGTFLHNLGGSIGDLLAQFTSGICLDLIVLKVLLFD